MPLFQPSELLKKDQPLISLSIQALIAVGENNVFVMDPIVKGEDVSFGSSEFIAMVRVLPIYCHNYIAIPADLSQNKCEEYL